MLLEGVAPLGVVGDGGFGPFAAYSTVTNQTLPGKRYPAAGCRAGGDDALGERRFVGALMVATRFRIILEAARGEGEAVLARRALGETPIVTVPGEPVVALGILDERNRMEEALTKTHVREPRGSVDVHLEHHVVEAYTEAAVGTRDFRAQHGDVVAELR